jgi:hypothetical protein
MGYVCQKNCACSQYLTAVGVDTSHVAVLARAVAGDAAALRELLEVHGCEGTRGVFSSRELLREEMDELKPTCGVSAYAPGVTLSGVLQSVAAVDHNAVECDRLCAHKQPVPEASTSIKLQPRDGTLVEVAEQQTDGAAVVSDDEHLLKWMLLAQEAGVVDVHAIPSLTFLGSLHRCGAIPDELLEIALEREEQHHAMRALPRWISRIKMERVRTELNRFAGRVESRVP